MKIYTAQEVADILKLKVSVILKYVREGKIKKIKDVGYVRVTHEELENFIKGE